MASARIESGPISASIAHLKLPDGVVLDRLEIEASSASFVPETRESSLPSGALVRAYLSAQGIQYMLQDQLPPMITGLQVSLEPGVIIVECRVRVLLEIPVRAKLGLAIADQKELHVELIEVDKGGPVPGLIQNQLQAVNPVFKASDLPMPFSLDQVEINPDFVVVYGTVTL